MEFPRQEYWSGLPFPSPRESSPPRDWTPGFCISCSGRGILLPLSSQGSPSSGYSLKLFAHFVEVCLIPQGCAPWCGGLFSGSCVRSCMRSFPFIGLYKYIQLVDFFCSIPRLSTRKHHWPPSPLIHSCASHCPFLPTVSGHLLACGGIYIIFKHWWITLTSAHRSDITFKNISFPLAALSPQLGGKKFLEQNVSLVSCLDALLHYLSFLEGIFFNLKWI